MAALWNSCGGIGRRCAFYNGFAGCVPAKFHGRGRAPRGPEKRRARHRAIAPATDGHPPAFRNPQRQFSHYATAFQLRYGRNQPPLNHFPNHPTTAFQPRPNHRKPQPLHNRPSAARRTIPRLAKTHDSTILRVESKNDSDSTIPHPRSLNRQHRAAWPWLVY